jgi:hypothetical protein
MKAMLMRFFLPIMVDKRIMGEMVLYVWYRPVKKLFYGGIEEILIWVDCSRLRKTS